MKRRLRWAALALVVLAAVWLALSKSPPVMEGHARQFFGVWRTRSVAVALFLVWVACACLLASVSKRALVRFALVNGVFVFTWLAVEVAGLTLVDWSDFAGPAELSELGTQAVPHMHVKGTTHEDLAQSWGYPCAEIPFDYATDRHGFRNAADREGADVYLLGDSFLVAALVPFEQTLCARLEQRLSRPVMNVALIGLSVQAERDLLRDSKLPLDGRLVVQFVFEGNDLLDSASYRAKQAGEVPVADSRSFGERTLLNQLIVRAQRLTQPHPAYAPLHTGRIGDVEYRFGWVKSSWAGLEGELPHITETLADVRDRVRAAGGEYAVAILPSKLRVLGPLCDFSADSPLRDVAGQLSPVPEYVRAWAEREHVACLDLTEALRACAARGETPWFPGDTHWNASGHRAVADALTSWSPIAARRGN